MTRQAKIRRVALALLVVLLAAVIAAPHFNAGSFAPRIRAGLERALGRQVEIGDVRFSLLTGPAFSLEGVVIHDQPSIGLEPFAYVDSLVARPKLLSLVRGRLEFSSIRLEDAHINLVKTGPGSEFGHWNFESLLSRNLLAAFPSIRILGRINFKFGPAKSVFYVTDADLEVTPPSRGSSAWSLRFTGQPARTDRPAQGFGSLEARGRWSGDRLDLNLQIERNSVSEIIALIRGQHAGVHGLVSSRVRLSGPLDNLQISGNVMLEDIHRWDQMPPRGNGWPLALAGRLDTRTQTLELESHSASRETPPISVRFRASDYLSQPHWGVSVNWNQFPLAPLLELARHMGANFPPKLKVAGTLDGAIGYAGQGSLQGELAFHDSVVTIPDSAPIRFEKARLLFDRGHLHLAPAVVRISPEDQAELEADYAFDTQAFDLSISTESMNVASLRSQVALAAVPWLEQVRSGHWSGLLRYQSSGWSGKIELEDAEIPLPGLAEPLRLETASAQIQGPHVALDRIRAHVGKIQAQGAYSYEPGAARPHHLRLVMAELDGAELERVLAPVLLRRGSLIARAIGRVPLPDWLATRHLDGTVQIAALKLGDTRVERLRARLLWDALKVELNGIQARIENGIVTGTLAVNLRGARPAYRLVSRLKSMDCRSGKVDAEAVLETSGTGAELLENLRAGGTFNGRAIELASLPPFKTVSGAYKYTGSRKLPRVELTDLQLATASEVYTGRGATQDDGRLVVQLSSGSKEMRVSGSLAQLRIEESPVSQ